MINQTGVIHNRFDFEVRDAKSGLIKQRARAYNIILDQFFTDIKCDATRSNYITSKIAIGSGTGTPAVTDTALFSQIATLAATQIADVREYPTGYKQVQATIQATDYVGQTITEVGLVNGNGKLVTKAMLKDSEGNQISIAKSASDVVVITATLYCTVTLSGFGVNGKYPAAENNKLFELLFGSGVVTTFDLRGFPQALSSSDALFSKFRYGKAIASSNIVNSSAGRFDFSLTVLTSEGDDMLYPTFGVPGLGAFSFPDHDVLPLYAITGKTIGSGDGSTQDFNIGCPKIVEGSEKIYVDGVQMAKDADYEIDYESNCFNSVAHYPSCRYSVFDPQVTFGNFAQLTCSSQYRYDPTLLTSRPSSTNVNYPTSSISVSAALPVIFDFETTARCNRLRIASNLTFSYTESTFKIQRSDNGTDWTDVTSLVWDATNKWFTFDAAPARYWRLYPISGIWSVSIQSNNTIGVYPDDTPSGSQQTGTVLALGFTTPGLHFLTPPAAGKTITADYSIDVPYHTANNLLNLQFSIVFSRG